MTVVPASSRLASGSGGGAMTQVAAGVLSGSQASISVGSIPQTGSALVILANLRTDAAAVQTDTVRLRFNGDTGANYGWGGPFGGTSGGNVVGSSDTSIQVKATGATADANHFAACYFTLLNYASASAMKQLTGTMFESRLLSGNQFAYAAGGFWSSTAAITSLTLGPVSGTNFIAGSAYGVYIIT